MKILVRSAVALALGIATIPAIAQTEQPVQGEGGAEACEPGSPNCPPAAGKGDKPVKPGAQGGTEVQGQADQKAPATEGQATDTTKPKTQDQAGETTQPKTGGQADATGKAPDCQPGDTSAACQPGAQGQAGDTTKPKTDGQAQTEQPADSDTTASISNVTVEQKTEIVNVIREEKVEPVPEASINFEINVGTVVPRTIELRPVPRRIIQIVPAYERYVYFVLVDGRIVIVEPDTLKIIVIITV